MDEELIKQSLSEYIDAAKDQKWKLVENSTFEFKINSPPDSPSDSPLVQLAKAFCNISQRLLFLIHRKGEIRKSNYLSGLFSRLGTLTDGKETEASFFSRQINAAKIGANDIIVKNEKSLLLARACLNVINAVFPAESNEVKTRDLSILNFVSTFASLFASEEIQSALDVMCQKLNDEIEVYSKLIAYLLSPESKKNISGQLVSLSETVDILKKDFMLFVNKLGNKNITPENLKKLQNLHDETVKQIKLTERILDALSDTNPQLKEANDAIKSEIIQLKLNLKATREIIQGMFDEAKKLSVDNSAPPSPNPTT